MLLVVEQVCLGQRGKETSLSALTEIFVKCFSGLSNEFFCIVYDCHLFAEMPPSEFIPETFQGSAMPIIFQIWFLIWIKS